MSANRGGFHDYRAKFNWVIKRVKHYAEKTGVDAAALLDAWEDQRTYWYMSYYQDCKQPEIKSDKVWVFDTIEELQAAIGNAGFRCPCCAGVSKSPYTCDSGQPMDKKGSICDWKAYGLLGTLGKGASVFIKSKLMGETIFMPVAWETKPVATPVEQLAKLKEELK